MANLAIRGHINLGWKVIKTLEMLGGVNKFNLEGNTDHWYVLEESGTIRYCEILFEEKEFTIEEFLEKFPYKVGDRVRVPEYESEVCISKMYWDGNEVQYEVVTDEVEWYSAKELNEFNEPNKEETIKKEKNDWAKWDLPDGYEFQDKEGNVINTDVIKLVKKQSLYPKTYEECYDVLGRSFLDDYIEGHKWELIMNFQNLLVCRDAYWKIAGEQMGLGKPWEPDLENEELYCIQNYNNQIVKSKTNTAFNKILIFPTEEMRDAFCENFRELIEQCKELL